MIDKYAVYNTITNKSLTHEQKLTCFSRHTENALEAFDVPERTSYFFRTGSINDLFEGDVSCRSSYIQPDYQLFAEKGGKFSNLKPPKKLDELLFTLMILYRHVPSVINFPVHPGGLDKLTEPFRGGLSNDEARAKLRSFFNYCGRTITDSFCHASLWLMRPAPGG